MAEQKTKQTDADVTAFINSVTDEQKRKDSNNISTLMSEITGEKPKMWGPSIIGFGSYHYKYDSGHEGDACLIGFSPRKQNIAFYLMSGYVSLKYSGYDKLLQNLGKYKLGKGCLYINKLDDVNIEILKELINISAKLLREKYEGA